MSNPKQITINCAIDTETALKAGLNKSGNFEHELLLNEVAELSQEARIVAAYYSQNGNCIPHLTVNGTDWASIKAVLEEKAEKERQDQAKKEATEKEEKEQLFEDYKRVLAAKDNPESLVDIDQALKPSANERRDPASIEKIKIYKEKGGQNGFSLEDKLTRYYPDTAQILEAALDYRNKINKAFSTECRKLKEAEEQAAKEHRVEQDRLNKELIRSLLTEEQQARFDEGFLSTEAIGDAIYHYVFVSFKDAPEPDQPDKTDIDHLVRCEAGCYEKPFKNYSEDETVLTEKEFANLKQLKKDAKRIEDLKQISELKVIPRRKTLKCNSCGQSTFVTYARITVVCCGYDVGKSIAI